MSNYLTLRHAGIWQGKPFDSGRKGSRSAGLAYPLDRGEQMLPDDQRFVATPGDSRWGVSAPVGKMFSAPLAVGCCDACRGKTATGDIEGPSKVAVAIGVGVAAYLLLKK